MSSQNKEKSTLNTIQSEMEFTSICGDVEGLNALYRKAAKLAHPDLAHGDAEAMIELNQEVAHGRRKAELVNATYFIAAVLDDSGSMKGQSRLTLIKAFNQFVQDQQEVPFSTAKLSVQLINKQGEFPFTDVQNIQAMKRNDFVCHGGTPLLDGVGRAIQLTEAQNPDRVVVLIISDGGECSSRSFTYATLCPLVEEKLALGWQFIYVSTCYYACKQAERMGIPKDCIASISSFEDILNLVSRQMTQLRIGEIKQITFNPESKKDNTVICL